MKLLTLCGKAGSGKNTAADIITDRFHAVELAFADPLKEFVQAVFDFEERQLWGSSEYRDRPDDRFENDRQWLRVENSVCGTQGQTWATRLAQVAGKEPGIAHVRLCGWLFALKTECEYLGHALTPRLALQRLGTDYGRKHLHPDVWVRFALSHAKRLLDETKADFAVFTDGRFPNEVLATRAAGGRSVLVVNPWQEVEGYGDHVSEHALDGLDIFDATVENDKREGLPAFERKLIAAVLSLKNRP